MGSHEEEQALEIEALQSLFEEGREFESISPTEFLLKLVPYPAGEEENHVGVTLHVTYTPEYPETAPDWELKDIKGLNDEKTEEVKGKVEEMVEASLGMAMVYQMAEACQDYLKENNEKELSMHEQMMKRHVAENGPEEEEGDDEEDDDDNAEEEEWKGLAEKELVKEEDRITIESFAEWKINFDAEMIAAGILKREGTKAKTGRQIFLEAQPQTKDGESPGAAGGGAEGAPVYNAALFGEGEDADLDDLDDLDDD